ncbi:hypothetical protein [Micromonospora fluostatini]|uniref:hypothetical protein n=1 Tax=Micromonospora sp. JCM 30529 TaxID=3421643 RepID=UPI003D180D13
MTSIDVGGGCRTSTGWPTLTQPGKPPHDTTRHSRAAPPSGAGRLDAELEQAVRRAARMRTVFYVLVLLVALAGQVIGATQKLDIHPLLAIPAVATLELGGVVVMANADVRRRLGEHAVASRILSAAVAAAAVTFNWLSHDDPLVAGFFAGMSALGYLVWLMHVENLRRDRLRAVGALPATTPAYELLGHWLRHPLVTRRARSMAKAHPQLGLYGSLDAARINLRRERRDAAIATVLRRKIRSAVDPATAAIAVHVYDLDEIAARLAATADYDGLTNLIAADLTPTLIAATGTSRERRRLRWRSAPRVGGDRTGPEGEVPQSGPPLTRPHPDTTSPRPGRNRPEEAAGPDRPTTPADPPTERAVDETVPEQPYRIDERHPETELPEPVVPQSAAIDRADDGGGDEPPTSGGSAQAAPIPGETAAAVAYWLGLDETLSYKEIARRIGRTERTVRRNLPPGFHRPNRPTHA